MILKYKTSFFVKGKRSTGSQPAFAFPNLTIETPKQNVKSAQSY